MKMLVCGDQKLINYSQVTVCKKTEPNVSDLQHCSLWLTCLACSIIIRPADLHLRLNVVVAFTCSISCSWLLRRSRACLQSQNHHFPTRKCAHLVVSVHISLWHNRHNLVKENNASFCQLLRRCGCGDEKDQWCLSVTSFVFSVLWNSLV